MTTDEYLNTIDFGIQEFIVTPIKKGVEKLVNLGITFLFNKYDRMAKEIDEEYKSTILASKQTK